MMPKQKGVTATPAGFKGQRRPPVAQQRGLRVQGYERISPTASVGRVGAH